MTFWEHFFRLLPLRPWPALGALYWHLTRRRVRARNRLLAASADLPFAYDIWVSRVERNRELEPRFRESVASWERHPRFTILLYGSSDDLPDKARRSVQSVERQVYTTWDVLEASSLPEALARSRGDYIIPLRAGSALSPTALFRFAEALQTETGALLLYGDNDHLDSKGKRTRPWFKPEWNREMFLAQDYLVGSAAIERQLAGRTADRMGSRAWDISGFLLAVVEEAEDAIVHVPHIVCHCDPASEAQQSERVEAVAEHLRYANAVSSPGPFGSVKVQWPLPPVLPMVSIIVPTKDKLQLLRPCIESVLTQTSYENFEILVVDNGSVEGPTCDYLTQIGAHPKVRILSYPHPYNFSAINNFAAGHSNGTFLCLLNNDTEVVEADWLLEMMRYAVREDVGAVGAKLLYEDGTIQHAGVAVGIGGAAGHAHRFLPADQPGYFSQAHVAQFVTAVTAACLVVDRQKFEAVGGLDEAGFAVAFNDVDFCLKLQAAGWRNVYVPHAVLIHHESKSRGSDMSPKHFERYQRELGLLQKRWGTKTYQDPLHNPNLDRYSETFVVRL